MSRYRVSASPRSVRTSTRVAQIDPRPQHRVPSAPIEFNFRSLDRLDRGEIEGRHDSSRLRGAVCSGNSACHTLSDSVGCWLRREASYKVIGIARESQPNVSDPVSAAPRLSLQDEASSHRLDPQR